VEATLATIVASASALVYAVVGETITEKAGVVNLSMEGTIMLSAMTGFAVAYTTGSVLLGFLAAAGVGMLIAALVAFASIELRLNQIAVGFVMTLLAIELSSFLGDPYVGQHGPSVRAMPIPLLSDIPFLGRVLFRHNLSVYGSYLAIVGGYLTVDTPPGGGTQVTITLPEDAREPGN
jgi:simple sugar transport system permease protein